MTQALLDDGWLFRSLPAGDTREVVIPHDAMISEPRAATQPSGAHGAFFPGGTYEYTRQCFIPADAERSSLVFEGVQGVATVTVDGHVVGRNASVYREFEIDISPVTTPGTEHTITVHVDNSRTPSARWYTGSGLYRPVWLRTTGAARFAAGGIDLRTRVTPAGCEVDVVTDVERGDSVDVSVQLELADAGRVLATAAGEPGRLSMRVADPILWSAERPFLYTLIATVFADGRESERIERRIGLRTVQVDAQHGLRVSDEPTLLRGACIHHDNGVLGAATFPAAERRRARILKEQGYNAVRSAHNPLSRAFLEACDELGLYVLDELTDIWFRSKTTFDAAPRFDDEWPQDAAAMVAKDRLHPSVIMYSIGNEIGESATPTGIETAQRMAEFVTSLDPTRPTTLAINFVLSMLAGTKDKPAADAKDEQEPSGPTSTTVNAIANRIIRIIQVMTRLPRADAVSKGAFAAVQVAGYNYGWVRYPGDARRHPERVVLGSESFPADIAKIWPLVEKYPHIIGDFAWTGWEYLGEVGLGTWTYGEDRYRQAKAYPQITSGCGVIDLLGDPGAQMLLARSVWALDPVPRIAVRPLPEAAGGKVNRMLWRGSDAVPSWAWKDGVGHTAEVEVYSAADEVELVLNGRSIGRRPAGARHGHVARFRVPYEAGEILAIARSGGVESGRSVLRSAGATSLIVRPETGDVGARASDIAFIRIEIADADGTIEMTDDDDIEVSISGGTLVALGSAAPATTESYRNARHRTYRGRALAVVRAAPGSRVVHIEVVSRRHGTTSTQIASYGEQNLQ